MDNYRNNILDNIRGILIILMVWGHCGLPGTNVIYLFHIPIFFMISGMLYKSLYSESLRNVKYYIKKKIRRLWIPYFISNTVFLLLNNFFVKVNIYEADSMMNEKDILRGLLKNFCFFGGTQMGTATWFLRCLFEVSVIVVLLDWFLRRRNISSDKKRIFLLFFMILFLLFIVQWIFNNSILPFKLVKEIRRVLYGMIPYCMGIYMRQINVRQKRNYSIFLKICFVFMSICSLIALGRFGYIDLAIGQITDIFYFVICTLIGFLLCYIISEIMYNNKMLFCGFVSVCSKNSIYIMILHFLCFKLVSFFLIIVKGETIDRLSYFPGYIIDTSWGYIYLLVGIIGPIFISYLFSCINTCISNMRVSNK